MQCLGFDQTKPICRSDSASPASLEPLPNVIYPLSSWLLKANAGFENFQAKRK